ncbi:unnamed protein product [Calypogeia fissa]
MAIVSTFSPLSTYSSRLWKGSEVSPVPKLSNPVFFLPQSSPVHHQFLTSTSSSPLYNSRTNKTSKRRTGTAIAMTLQMEEAATANGSSAPKPELVEIPTVVEITIPPGSLVGFEADYERVSKTWAADLPTTTDDAKIEQFVTSAQALVRRWLPEELVYRLEHLLYDPAEPPVLVVRGLPIDKDLPPTEKDVHLKKMGKHMSETWLVGVSRIVGQVFTFGFVRGQRPGMGLLIRELYPFPEKANLITSEGSKELLDFHLDFGQVPPEKFPNILAFMGIRGDPNHEGHTLVCNNRKLYKLLDPADIEILRKEKLAWNVPAGQFSQYVIKGPESNPQISLFEENLSGMSGFDSMVLGSPEALAAYRRVKELASTLVESVYLGGGDMFFLNQKKANHGRGKFFPKFDGNDRWLQRTYINSGGFWEAGYAEWPSRTIAIV